jgi:hypothetical protein
MAASVKRMRLTFLLNQMRMVDVLPLPQVWAAQR